MARFAPIGIVGLLLAALIVASANRQDRGYLRWALEASAQESAAKGEDLASTPGPSITSLPSVIYVGNDFLIRGSGFSAGSVVNFFVPTARGVVNFGPLIPTALLPDSMMAFVPATITQGEGVASVQVVNTDQNHISSNPTVALLEGDTAAGMPSLTAINGVGLSPTSLDPNIAVANVEAVVVPGAPLKLAGNGFDVVNGVGVDLFCDCPAGKVGPFFLLPGNPGLGSGTVTFPLPSGPWAPGTGPGAFQVTNLGNGFKSAAVSVPIGARIWVSGVTQSGSTVSVNGTGFSSLTIINLFNAQGATVVNLGGIGAGGTVKIPLKLTNDGAFSFTLPDAIVAGPAFIQALNPPFIPFTSSGNDPSGSFDVTLKLARRGAFVGPVPSTPPSSLPERIARRRTARTPLRKSRATTWRG